MGGIFSINKKIESCETKKDHLLALNDEKKKSVKTPLKKKSNLGKGKRSEMLTRL